MTAPARLSRAQEYWLAFAAAVVTANAYYIHPIIGDVATHFGVSEARIGLVPALNQLALAVGILLLLPLGDRYSNRRLTIIFASGQTKEIPHVAGAPMPLLMEKPYSTPALTLAVSTALMARD